jgi:hypothetical protein
MWNDHPDSAGSEQDRPHASVGCFKVSFIILFGVRGSKYGKWQRPAPLSRFKVSFIHFCFEGVEIWETAKATFTQHQLVVTK